MELRLHFEPVEMSNSSGRFLTGALFLSYSKLVPLVSLILGACLLPVGCGLPRTHTRIYDGGYRLVTTTGGYPHEWSQSALEFMDPAGRSVRVWPWVEGGPSVRGGIAVFPARVPYEFSEARWRTVDRIFAVTPPSPPVDLTNEILARWAQAAGREPSQVIRSAVLTPMHDTQEGFEINYTLFGSAELEHITVTLNWQDVPEFMEEVRRAGVVRKEPRWNARCIEREFK